MNRILICTTALTFWAAASAVTAAPMVKEIEVTADLTAIENPQAATYWTHVADDVENAIVTRLTDRISDDGVSIVIDLSEVELSNSFQEALNVADTKMVGIVNVKPQEPGDKGFNSYELTVNINQAMVFMPEGTDVTKLSQDTTVYYDAMVNAFADAVVVRLK